AAQLVPRRATLIDLDYETAQARVAVGLQIHLGARGQHDLAVGGGEAAAVGDVLSGEQQPSLTSCRQLGARLDDDLHGAGPPLRIQHRVALGVEYAAATDAGGGGVECRIEHRLVAL